jgi:hypothetical protein
MMRYRVYLLDSGNKIFHGQDGEAPDDAAAIAAACNLFETHNILQPSAAQGIEVWLGRNLVFNSQAGAD